MRKISPDLRELFEVEIRNERQGGVSPATLDSCIDSLRQAPIDAIRSWLETDDEEIIHAMIELAALVIVHGPAYELRNLI